MTIASKTARYASEHDAPAGRPRTVDGAWRRGTPHRPRPARPRRASRILRDLLASNEGVQSFTVQHIMTSIAADGVPASLMLLTVPAIVPVPGTAPLAGRSTVVAAGSLIAARPSVRLPRAILERSVPRRSLALVIHAILPVLERMERLTRERWSWLSTPAAHRAIGVIVFLLALPLAFPVLGFGLPHAVSLFTIALGMIERDGLVVALGVVAGIAALVLVTGRHVTPTALARKLATLVKTVLERMVMVRKVAGTVFARAWRWLVAKLLSGPPARSTQTSVQAPRPTEKLRLATPFPAIGMETARSPIAA